MKNFGLGVLTSNISKVLLLSHARILELRRLNFFKFFKLPILGGLTGEAELLKSWNVRVNTI